MWERELKSKLTLRNSRARKQIALKSQREVKDWVWKREVAEQYWVIAYLDNE